MDHSRKTFGDLCGKALERRYDAVLLESTENGRCSKEHYRKMSAILGQKVRRPITTGQKIALAILAAALLLLTGCAIRYGETLGEFIVGYFDTHYTVDPVNGEQEAERIEDVYSIAQLPVGYALVREEIKKDVVYRKYVNEEEREIIFLQDMDRGTSFLDNESSLNTLTVNGKSVLQYQNGDSKNYIYFWNDRYYFQLNLPSTIPEEEAIPIIEGIMSSAGSQEK